jgi:4-amino-4-deoxy-L-arabinose transferase-like glycosyltransferase
MTAVATARRADRRRAAVRAPATLAVVGLTLAGAGLRLSIAGQSLFGDELSTHWIVSTNGLGGVLAILHDEVEITPPLSFVVSWLTTRLDMGPELLRAPSLLAGTAAIPLVYAVGVRTVGRAAAIVAAALTALAPFMVYYSAEARAYMPMLTLVLLSALALLVALEQDRARWWVGYAACSCAAVYTHYTAVFALAAQLAWVLLAHPEARRAALLANAGAAIAFLPWATGFVNDLRSPDGETMSILSPFTPFHVRLAIEHWSVGYPYGGTTTELRDLPGVLALAAMALGLAIALASAAARLVRAPRPLRIADPLVLVVALALSAPVAEAAVSAVGTNLFAARNLAVSWPWFALALAAILVAAGPRLRYAACALVIAGFAIGAVKVTQAEFQRPDYRAAAAFVDAAASRDDVVLDHAAVFVAPGPLTGLDSGLRERHRIIRVGVPEQRERNFGRFDPIATLDEVVRRATAVPGRIFVVSADSGFGSSEDHWDRQLGAYRRVQTRSYPGFIRLTVLVYEPMLAPR